METSVITVQNFHCQSAVVTVLHSVLVLRYVLCMFCRVYSHFWVRHWLVLYRTSGVASHFCCWRWLSHVHQFHWWSSVLGQ